MRRSKKRRINITIDEDLHVWFGEIYPDTFSGWINEKLYELSCSCAIMSGTFRG